MATKKTTTEDVIEEVQADLPVGPAPVNPWEKVEVKLPRESGKDEMVYVSVNEYSCIIPRGKSVMVPRFIKEELDRSAAAVEAMAETTEKLLEQSK